jgi:hypothetical protein
VRKNLGEISTMMPERVQTTTLRCFVKYDEKFEAAKHAFTAYCKDKLGGAVIRAKELSHSQMCDVLQSQSVLSQSQQNCW